MSDNRFCYLHMTDDQLRALDDSEDDALLNEPLPEEDIEIPPGLIPPLQEEEDESEGDPTQVEHDRSLSNPNIFFEGILPAASHPSYPYGNPYTLSLLPLRPSARSTKKGLKGNPHTRHMHTWPELALEDLLPWEGEEPDLNYFAGLEAEAAAAAHAAAAAAAAAAVAATAPGAADVEMEGQQQQPEQETPSQVPQQVAEARQERAAGEAMEENSENGSDSTSASDS